MPVGTAIITSPLLHSSAAFISYSSALISYTVCCKMTEILGPAMIHDEVIIKRSERHELDP